MASSSSGLTRVRMPRAGVQRDELGVRAKAAAGPVDRVELPLDRRAGSRQRAGSSTRSTTVVPSACQLAQPHRRARRSTRC